MRGKITTLFILAVLCLSLTGIAAAQDTTEWESCGTKVVQGEIDAVYSLTPDDYVRIEYGDTNSNKKYDIGEGVYVDMTHPEGQTGVNYVEVGDVRLTAYCGKLANTMVCCDEPGQNDKLEAFPGEHCLIGFVDVNNDGVYDLGDPLYVDTDDNDKVTAGDVRLTIRVVSTGDSTKTYPAYSVVSSSDWDANRDLLDLVNPDEEGLTTKFYKFIGYIDSDCSGDWTTDCPGVDKLYLQQLKGEINNDVAQATADGDDNGPSDPADCFVTIGDLRLFVPSDEVNWPDCGTKVEQGDIDAVYTLTFDDFIRIKYGDTNSNENYDIGECVYADMTHPEDETGVNYVEVGDVRLTAYCGKLANTIVCCDEPGQNDKLRAFPGPQGERQDVIGFVDINDDKFYDLGDAVYVDTDDNEEVSAGDVRLTERSAISETYPAYSVVMGDDFDVLIDGQLRKLEKYDDEGLTEFSYIVGYIDSDCSGDWTTDCPGVDKLYLQQPRERLFGAEDEISDYVVSIGDLRLFIPPDEANWPNCGTKVKQGDIDAVYALTEDDYIRIMYADENSNNKYDCGEGIYVDMTHPRGSPAVDDYIEAGDIRLTASCGKLANTMVDSCEDPDYGVELQQLNGRQDVIGFVDVNNDGVYDLGDPLYIDADDYNNKRVSAGDVRLTERTIDDTTYAAYSVVSSEDLDQIGTSVLLNPEDPEDEDLGEFCELVGYIDSDCSGDWTNCPGVDKLYLQQIREDSGDECGDDVVTIGDLRLYIPPEEIANDDNGNVDEPEFWEQYDTNPEDDEINDDEVLEALGDYFAQGSVMTDEQILNVLGKYFS